MSRLHLQGHPDQPEWLSHVNAGMLKVKLATALIGISSIHLLKSFIEAQWLPTQVLMWPVIIQDRPADQRQKHDTQPKVDVFPTSWFVLIP